MTEALKLGHIFVAPILMGFSIGTEGYSVQENKAVHLVFLHIFKKKKIYATPLLKDYVFHWAILGHLSTPFLVFWYFCNIQYRISLYFQKSVA